MTRKAFKDELPIPLYHGTSSLFLGSIIRSGLGGLNPIAEWHLLEFARLIYPLVEKHVSTRDDFVVKAQTFRFMVEQKSAAMNFQHGDTYLSPSLSTAVRYAVNKRYGSELLTYTLDFLAELQLYTDEDEMLFDAVRPVILNGIEEIITKPDLADRTLFLTLEPIPEENRRTEQEFWAAFESARPRILGVLLDAVARGLDMLPHTRLERLPRMADFALWVTACETSLWPAGTFGAAYCGNRDTAVEAVLEADLVAVAVRALMAERPEWTGTATELLGALGTKVGEPQRRSKHWPASANALSGRVRRLATFLRKVGVKIDFFRGGHANTRMIQVSLTPDNGWKQPYAPYASSANALKPNGSNGFVAHPMRAVSNHADEGVD